MPPRATSPTIASPCIGICVIDPEGRLCRGCRRTLAEIAAWPTAGESAKRAILDRIALRPSN